MNQRMKRIGLRAGLLSTAGFAGVTAFAGAASAADIPVVIPPPPIVTAVVVQPEPEPSFWATFQVLYATRNTPPESPILTPAPIPQLVAGPIVTETDDGINAEDFDFGWHWGFAARVGMVGENVGFDIGGFWYSPFRSGVEYTNVGEFENHVLELANDIDPTITFLDTAEAWNTTRLWGLDANFTLPLGTDAIQLFAGVAYVRLTDELDLDLFRSPDGDVTDNYNWFAANRMFGPQIGARLSIWGDDDDRFTLAADVRAALLFNRVDVTFDGTPEGGTAFGDEDDVRVRSWLVAGGINAGFKVSDSVAVTVGYQAMWFHNVALAPGQVGTTTVADGDPLVATTEPAFGNLLVHGLAAGITINF